MIQSTSVPGTVSRRINAERLVLLGWCRAILLQLAHPLVAAGVRDHSDFRGSPFAAVTRLHHTVRAMLALTFGDDESYQRAVNGILAIHQRVNGTLDVDVGSFPVGTPYSAEDPSLVLWVHATLVESVPMIYELLIRPLSERERDAYCHEAAPVAEALGARPHEVPVTWAALRAYLDRTYASGAITVSPAARELSRAIMTPPGATLVAPAAWVNDLLTVGLLPESVRSQYGFEWSPRRERALGALVRVLRAGRKVTPQRLALWRASRT